MHISEGILPLPWAGLWFVLAIPFIIWGLRDIKKRTAKNPGFKAMAAMVGAAIFIISCMPIPIPTAGTCSHPCGTGLGAILIGPGPTIVVASIGLLLQALFLAHGGLTTFGADVMSMGVGGALAGYWIFKLFRKIGLNFLVAAFAAGLITSIFSFLIYDPFFGNGLEPFFPIMMITGTGLATLTAGVWLKILEWIEGYGFPPSRE